MNNLLHMIDCVIKCLYLCVHLMWGSSLGVRLGAAGGEMALGTRYLDNFTPHDTTDKLFPLQPKLCLASYMWHT